MQSRRGATGDKLLGPTRGGRAVSGASRTRFTRSRYQRSASSSSMPSEARLPKNSDNLPPATFSSSSRRPLRRRGSQKDRFVLFWFFFLSQQRRFDSSRPLWQGFLGASFSFFPSCSFCQLGLSGARWGLRRRAWPGSTPVHRSFDQTLETDGL